MRSGQNRVLLLGGAGTGKSTRLREAFLAADPERRLMLLPTSSMVRHARDLLIPEEGTALFDDGLTTLLGLSLRVLEARAPTMMADEASCLACVRQAMEKRSKDLRPFDSPARYPGFARTALAWIRELRQAGLDHRTLEKSRSQSKLATARLLRDYEASLREACLVDQEMALKNAALAFTKGRYDFSSDLLLIDGFYEFTPLQAGLVIALIERSDRCIVSLIWPEERKLGLVERTRSWFADLGFVEERLGTRLRFKSKALKAVEQGLFSAASREQEEPEGLLLLEAADPEDEAMWVARDVIRQVQNGARYSDILIVRRSLQRASGLWRRIFGEKGVPIEVMQPEPITSHPAIAELLGLFRVIVNDLEAMPWILAAPGLGLSDDDLQKIVGIWRTSSPPSSLRTILDLAESNGHGTAADARRLLVRWSDELQSASSPSSAIKILDRITVEVGMKGALQLYKQRIEEDHGLRAAALSAMRRGLRSFIHIAEIQACDGFNASMLVDSLSRYLEGKTLGTTQRARDMVHMVDALEARNWEARIVYLTGLNEREFPPKLFQDSLFPDEERGSLASRFRLKTAYDRVEEERLLFYMAATRASEKMTLSFCASDESGARLSKSFWLEDLLRLFPEGSVRKELPGHGRLAGPGQAVLERDLIRFSADAAGRRRAGLKLSAEDGAMSREIISRDSSLRAALAKSGRSSRGKLGRPEMVRGLRGLIEPLSPSRADTFAQCPFKFFCERVLRLSPGPQPPVFDARAEGAVFHEVLRLAFENGQIDQWPDILRRQLELAHEKFGRPDDQEQVRLRLMSAINATIRSEAETMRRSGMKPRYFEAQFGPDCGRPCSIRVPEDMADAFPAEELHLQGKIDRVDAIDADCGEVGLVIDYKMSKRGWPERRELLEAGLENQPGFYAIALVRAFGMVPAGMVYITCHDGKRDGIVASDRLPEGIIEAGAKTAAMSGPRLDEWIEMEERRIIKLAGRMYSGAIVARPARLEACGADNCAYSDVCRFRPEWEGESE